jgi:hypothetical protein
MTWRWRDKFWNQCNDGLHSDDVSSRLHLDEDYFGSAVLFKIDRILSDLSYLFNEIKLHTIDRQMKINIRDCEADYIEWFFRFQQLMKWRSIISENLFSYLVPWIHFLKHSRFQQ